MELGALGGSALIAGSMFLFTSFVKDAFPPLSLVMFRMLLGCAGLALAQLGAQVTGLDKVHLSSEETLYLCAIGWMNTVLPYSLYAAALGKGESVSAASALAGATPVFTAGLAMALKLPRGVHRGTGPAQEWRGLLLGLCGVFLIVFRRGSWSQGSFEGLGLQLMGVLLKASAACLTQAKNSRKHRQASPLLQALVQALSGAGLAVLLSLTLDGTGSTPHWLDPLDLVDGKGYGFLQRVSQRQWLCLLCMSLLGSCLVYLLQFYLLARVGAVRQSLMDQLALVIGVFEGGFFRGEWHQASTWEVLVFLLGTCLVLTATAILYHPVGPVDDGISLEPMVSRDSDASAVC
eukprot:s542_g4.t1